jgi:hypothetical protein
MLHNMKEVQLHALTAALNGTLHDTTPVLPTGRPVGLKSQSGSGGKEKNFLLAGNPSYNQP